MKSVSAPGLTHHEAARHGGPCSALRLVEAGEDPRILSTNPDYFFRKPWANMTTSGLLALIIASVLAVRFITIDAWDTNGDLPWFWNVIWLIFPWIFLTPFWGLWIWRQLRDARVHKGREALAAMVREGPAERGQTIWVSHNSDNPIGWRQIEALVVAEASGGEAVFVDARFKTRPSVQDELFRIGDPIWLWRSKDGWVFGQIALHGLDPTCSPADEPPMPTWEEMHGGHSPDYFITRLSSLAGRYRSGAITHEEYEAEKSRLLDIGRKSQSKCN